MVAKKVDEKKAASKTRTRKPKTTAPEPKAAATAEAPTASEPGTAPTALATDDSAPQVAEDVAGATKICACHRNNGESCGRPAPDWGGPFNEDCYVEHQIELGKVQCANSKDNCKHWVIPFKKNGEIVPTYCRSCYSGHQQNRRQEQAKEATQSLEERVQSSKEFCYNMLATLAGKFPQVDFTDAVRLRDEANELFALGDNEEANTSFQSALNKANRLVGEHCQSQISGLAAEIKGFIESQRDIPERIFTGLLSDTERDADPGDIALIGRESAKIFSLDMQQRVDNLKNTLAEAQGRATKFAPPDLSRPRPRKNAGRRDFDRQNLERTRVGFRSHDHEREED